MNKLNLLLRFLKDNDALKNYEKDFVKYKYHENTIIEFVNKTFKSSLIDTAFSWWGSNKGYHYWYHLNSKWYKFLRENGSRL